MNLKSLGRKATARMGRQILSVRTHSPSLLLSAGVIGATASVVLACRATLKLSDVLDKGENDLKSVDVEHDSDASKKTFNVQLQTAIGVAKLYAPATLLFAGSLAAVASSHVILKRRNAGLVASYVAVDTMFRNYRGRVVADQGEEKDFEYLHGVEEREIVEEGPDGPVVKSVKGLDQEAIENMDPETIYARVFNRKNKHWTDIPNQNQFFLQMIQSELNDLLRMQGYVFLNQAYDLLGFPPTRAGATVGWLKKPKDGEGDAYIDLDIWSEGIFRGTKWLTGDSEAVLLNFNVDGPILDVLPKV